MKIDSIPTRGRTLDHAALVYDFCEPILLLGKQAEYDLKIVSLLELKLSRQGARFRLRNRGIMPNDC